MKRKCFYNEMLYKIKCNIRLFALRIFLENVWFFLDNVIFLKSLKWKTNRKHLVNDRIKNLSGSYKGQNRLKNLKQ
jgi:hypothetical protein